MKKIIVILIAFNILFIANKTSACVVMDGGCYNLVSCGGKLYKTQDDVEYKQCINNEKVKADNIYREEQEAKNIIYKGRVNELSQYSDFFEKVGINLTIDTSNEQYTKWLGELKEAKNDYIKEQENQLKIKELEERINNLESKPAIIEKVITTKEEVVFPRNKEEVIKPTISDNKIIKPTLKKDEIVKEKPSTIMETTTKTEIPVILTNKSFIQRVFNWFKSLL